MFDSITQIFNTTVNNHAQQAKFNERLREVKAVGDDRHPLLYGANA